MDEVRPERCDLAEVLSGRGAFRDRCVLRGAS